MRRNCLAFFLLLTILFAPAYPPALSEGSLALSVVPNAFNAGESVTIYFDAPKKGTVDLVALDESGVKRATIASEQEAQIGLNELTWDGASFGAPLPSGTYTLRLSMGTMSVEVAVQIASDAAPYAQETMDAQTADQTETAPADEAKTVPQEERNTFGADASLYPAPASRSAHTPQHDADGCYWCTPMDITDEAAVWAMLTAPITVVEAGQKEQVVLRAEPDDNADGVGVITGASQGVHVLEKRDDGWSLVECYSSSFFDSKVKAWNAFVTGYIRTSKLTTKKVDQEYGIVIDKLTQRLYLFKEGHLLTELLVSTGLYNQRQPYNETRSGEFMLVSKVGDFRSDAMICSMALRFDGGDLLHEVPHVLNADKTKNYKSTEYKLGSRGSHGCIRVQRLKNADGINMSWLWKNLAVGQQGGTKLVIWEDFAGRQITIPDASTPVYYNPNGGSYYHSTATCSSVKDQFLPLTAFTYGELDDASFKDLTPCPYCIPEKRASELEKINQDHLTQSPGMVSDYHK